MRLMGPKSGQLGPINHCLLEESQWEKELILSTQDWVWVLSPVYTTQTKPGRTLFRLHCETI